MLISTPRRGSKRQATASSPLKLIDFGLAGFAQQLRENAIEALQVASLSGAKVVEMWILSD